MHRMAKWMVPGDSLCQIGVVRNSLSIYSVEYILLVIFVTGLRLAGLRFTGLAGLTSNISILTSLTWCRSDITNPLAINSIIHPFIYS